MSKNYAKPGHAYLLYEDELFEYLNKDDLQLVYEALDSARRRLDEIYHRNHAHWIDEYHGKRMRRLQEIMEVVKAMLGGSVE